MAKSPLVIDLDRIPEGEPLALSFDDALPEFVSVLRSAAEGQGTCVSGRADLELESWPGRIDVTGGLQADLDATCARCLVQFSLRVDRKIVHILVSTLEGPDGDEEIELHSNDLDRSLITGTTVDLGAVLREELLLGMPMKATCTDSCKGICGGCGAELNTEPCICEPETDERWSALAALKTDEN